MVARAWEWDCVEGQERAEHAYKRPTLKILTVLKIFSILTVVVNTRIYTGDETAENDTQTYTYSSSNTRDT